MNQPDVSFILTCFNLQNYVEAAIQSLLAQEGKYTFEIIIIDDCSTDDSVAVIERIKDERIRFIKHTQNRGAAASINEAFALAQGKYIGRFDADDVWFPHFLNTTVPLLENNPQLGLVYGDICIINSAGEVTDAHCQVPNYTNWDKASLLQALLTDYLICAPATLARKEAWELALPLPEYLLYCDFELALHMATHLEFQYIPQVLAQYRLHPQNMHSTAVKNRKAETSIFDTLHRFQQQYPNLLDRKSWKKIHQKRYLHMADQYFGLGEMRDARRCYWQGSAFMNLSTKGYFRRWLASYLPGNIYHKLKKWWLHRP